MSAAITAVYDAFKLEKEALLSEVDSLKKELSSRQNNESTAKLAQPPQIYNADVDVSIKTLLKSWKLASGLHL